MQPFSDSDASRLLFGANHTQRIVSIESTGSDGITIYRRTESNQTVATTSRHTPWVVIDPRLPTPNGVRDIAKLEGDLPLSSLVNFRDRSAFNVFADSVRAEDTRVLLLRSPVTQFLVRSGATLFKSMAFPQLRRMQLDIETLGLDPSDPAAEVIMVALRQDGWETVLLKESSEAELLSRMVSTIAELDPDVIEGHNIFQFDIPFLVERARQAGIQINIGRDGSAPIISRSTATFRVGPVSLPYTPVHIRGRHVVDTYQLIQRWDVQGRLSRYGLKSIMSELGIERDHRVHIRGGDIADMWRSGVRTQDRLAAYALDDVRDVERLSSIALPVEFYQTQMVPLSLQTALSAGMGSKIDHLMVRAYLAVSHSLPIPESPRAFAGAHLELLRTGIYGPIVKADIESLYPSIMIDHRVSPRSDTLGAFPLLLRDLTQRRIDAKRHAAATSGEEHALWDGLQGTFKVLINSFFGYLGFGRARFNDFSAAEFVTVEGQRLIQLVVAALRDAGGEPIEVDTDGVFFIPPSTVSTLEDEQALIDQLTALLPGRITVAHDGRYRRMMSLKLKTYALLAYDDSMTMKGSALRSRRMEPCFRDFLRFAALSLMADDRESARKQYFELAAAIQDQRLPPEMFSQWSMLKATTIESRTRLKQALEANPGRWRFGERVLLYERNDGAIGFTENYAKDENTGLLLRRLHETAARFSVLFENEIDFRYCFPPIQPTSSLEVLQHQQPLRQLSLFDVPASQEARNDDTTIRS